MATFGTLPGVKVTTSGGAVTGVTIGRAQYLVLVGHGDNSAGSASTNTAVQIDSRSDADTKFGPDTDLARNYRDALANGANRNFIYGVMADNTNTTESFASSASGTLANAPIVDDLDRVTVTDTGSGAEMTVNFVYESTVPTPSNADTVNINPTTGDWEADASSSYDITYDYSDWSGAISAAETVVDENEFGLITVLSNTESVASTLSSTLTSMRDQYKMVLGLMGAEPNATSNDGLPKFDTTNYSDNVDNDALFLAAPSSDADDRSILGALGGRFAGNDVSNPVHNDPVNGISDLSQTLTKSEANDLRDAEVIPIRDLGTPSVRSNTSTSTETDWERDYFRRRIVDLAVITAKAVAEEALGLINDEDTRSTTEVLIEAEMGELVDDGLIKSDTANESNLYVDVYKIDANTIGADLGITPYGVVKQVEIDLTIDT